MRSLMFVLVALVALPGIAQERVFRASSIDLEQNERLTAVEARVSALEQVPATLPAPKPKQVPAIVPRPQVALAQAPQATTARGVQRYTTNQLRYKIQQFRPGGWTGAVYAGMVVPSQVKQHLVGAEHGFSWAQIQGLTHEEAMILHDLAPKHGNKIFPQYVLASDRQSPPNQVAAQPSPKPQKQFSFDPFCPNGQCNKQQYQLQSQGRVPLLKRFFQ